MKTADQIIQPRWLAPVDGSDSTLENQAVVVNQDTIIHIGDAATVKSEYQSDNWLELNQHLLIPGLINTHTHAAMNLLRGYADDLPLMQWLTQHIWPAEEQWVDRDFVDAGTRLACAEMLLSGTTCFNDMYYFPDVVADCAHTIGMRACVGLMVIDTPNVWAGGADECISKGLEVRDSIRHSSLVTSAFAPHAPYTVSDEPLKKIAVLSEELDCPIHIHLHETQQEVDQSSARYGMRPLERINQLGLLTDRMLAVHMTQLLPGEIETIASLGVNVAHCPQSNLKLASGNCPVKKLMDAGVNVCLATDSAASNNSLDMIAEMKTAAILAKSVSEDPTAMTAHQTLQAATINGARALGLEQKIGSIEVGKQADMVAIDLSSPATQPLFNPVSQLVYAASSSQVSDVWVAGKQQVKKGELANMDIKEVLCNAANWQHKIAGG